MHSSKKFEMPAFCLLTIVLTLHNDSDALSALLQLSLWSLCKSCNWSLRWNPNLKGKKVDQIHPDSGRPPEGCHGCRVAGKGGTGQSRPRLGVDRERERERKGSAETASGPREKTAYSSACCMEVTSAGYSPRKRRYPDSARNQERKVRATQESI